MFAVFQEKNSHTREDNIGKYIAPLPIFNTIHVAYRFVEFLIPYNTAEFCIQDGRLKNFLHPQVYVHSHKISCHSSIITTKNSIVTIVKLL